MDDDGAEEGGHAAPGFTRPGRADWRADRPEADEELGSLWIRWTDGGTDLHLHRVCEILPHVEVVGEFPFLRSIPERGEKPTFVPIRDGRDAEPVQFRFISGLPRELLRHVPLVILLAALVMLVGAEFTPGVQGVSALVPAVTGPNAVLFGLFLLITPALLWLFSTVDVVEYREFPKAAVVYGLVVALAAGVAASILLVVQAGHPSRTSPNVVFAAGYLLMLLVGGQLLYEATLRLEHLLVKLGDREGDIVGNERAYRRFLTDLHDSLRARTVFDLPPSRLFGLLLAAQFAIIWVIGQGPQNLGFGVGLVVNFVLNAVLATVVFQFFVIVRYFNRLLNATEEYGDVELTYQPFHVDGHGGFRDLGRFATRFNVILTVGGLYLPYRLYVTGGRVLPQGGLAAIEDPILLSVWLVSNVGPIIAYALGVVAWGYYTFWSMHAKMVRDKHALARRYQGTTDRPDVDRTPAAGDPIERFDGSEGPAWSALVAAPTWPLDVSKMVSLLSGNAVPLVLPAANILF